MARDCVRRCPEIKRLSNRPAKSLRDQRRFSKDVRDVIENTLKAADAAKAVGKGAGKTLGGLAGKFHLAKRGVDFIIDARAARDLPRCMTALRASYDCTGPEPGAAGPRCPVMPPRHRG